MNKVESIFKNIALFLLGAIIFVAGYNINKRNHPEDGNSGATRMESNEAEEDGNSSVSQ